MNAITLLKDDHKKVKALFREYEQAGDRAYQTKQRIAELAFTELDVHSAIEEEIFYPAVRTKAGRDGKEIVAEGIEEHHVVKTLIEELRQLEPNDERYDAKFKVLIENVEHHIEEEESEMLPETEECLGDDIERLGNEMLRRKEQLLGQVIARS
jgi:hemerythrin-like domain-containing protein